MATALKRSNIIEWRPLPMRSGLKIPQEHGQMLDHHTYNWSKQQRGQR